MENKRNPLFFDLESVNTYGGPQTELNMKMGNENHVIDPRKADS